jgi:hypothetical protein
MNKQNVPGHPPDAGEEKVLREKYKKRIRKAGVLYGLMALVVIPVYTVFFATQADLITKNMSYIGGYMGGYTRLLIWGIVSALFYLGFSSYLFMLTRFSNARVRRMLLAACAMLVLTVALPFVPEVWPRMAQMHNTFAMLAPVIMVLVMYVFVFYLGKCDRAIYKKALFSLNSLVLVSAILMFFLGASGLLEVIFSVGMCVLLFLLLVWLSHSEQMDVVEIYRQAEARRKAREQAQRAEEAARRAEEALKRQVRQAQQAQEDVEDALIRAARAALESERLEMEKVKLEEEARQAQQRQQLLEERQRLEQEQAVTGAGMGAAKTGQARREQNNGGTDGGKSPPGNKMGENE